MKNGLCICLFSMVFGVQAVPSNLPEGFKFSFYNNDSSQKQVCMATPIGMIKESNRCMVKFFTAAHCGAGEFDYFKADFILGKVKLQKNGIVRPSDYAKLKKPGLDFASFNLNMPCGQADELSKVKFPESFQKNAHSPEVVLSAGQRVYVKNSKGFVLSGTIQIKSDFAFAYNVQIDGELVAASLIQTDQDLAPGDSGAAIYNEKGQLVGVVSGRKSKGSFYFSSLAVGQINLKI